MKNRKLWVSILAGVLVAAMLLGLLASIIPTRASAASSSEIKNQINELKEQQQGIKDQMAELESKISDNLSEMEDIVARKDAIDQEVFLLHEQVTNINDQIAAYGLLIADKQDELDAAEAKLADLNEKNKERIRAMEEDGSLSYWSVLFKANSFADLLDRLNMIEEIAAADQRRLEEMSQAAQKVQAAREELELEKAELESTKAELDASQVELDAKRAEADALLTSLIEKGEEFDALMDQAEAESEEILAQIAQKEKEYDAAKDAEYKQWLSTSVPPTTKPAPTSSGSSGGTAGTGNTVNGVTWLVPVNYTRVSSPFGMRIHPVTGVYKMHNGVDLAAPQGTPIIASRSGKVTISSYDSTSGYFVVLNHGDGYSSVYLHMTHYIVSTGDYVSAGQVIGYVGSTGLSTGPHLHFGIMYNGVYVNPANYINI